MVDRDLRYALHALRELGAVDLHGDVLSLTEHGQEGMRRATGDATPGDTVLQLKISLLGLGDPPVWRRLLVPAGIKLDRLHDLIQAAIGWDGYHMHAFSAGGVDYGIPDPELGFRDERRTTLGRVIAKPGDRLRYTYDFGDNWEHDILIEQVGPPVPELAYPVCLAGERACPPDDCGGVWGYAELLEALADPKHPEHEWLLEWAGGPIDPEAFDRDEVNKQLARLP